MGLGWGAELSSPRRELDRDQLVTGRCGLQSGRGQASSPGMAVGCRLEDTVDTPPQHDPPPALVGEPKRPSALLCLPLSCSPASCCFAILSVN